MKKTAKTKGGEPLVSSRNDLFFLFIVFVGLVFYFWGFTVPDIASDNALYSFRALGWLDYIGGGQTTPLQWFGHIPGWANLSFHDAPPLVFAIQNLFFSVLGPSVFAARLPFVLAGFSLIFILYFTIKQFKKEETALLGAFLLAVSSYGIWAARAGYLEGIEVLFIGLSSLFFVRYIKNERRADILWWGVFAGMALLSKYTALFILPAAATYILIWKREWLKEKNTWLAVVLMVVVLSPVIIYNFEAYQTRGHLDAALSAMTGMHSADFGSLSERGIGGDYLAKARGIFSELSGAISPGMFYVMLLSLVYAFVKIARGKADPLERFLFLNIFFAFVLFVVSGAALRFLSLLVPFLIASAAFFFSDIFSYLKERGKWFGFAFGAIVVIVIGWEMLYAANAHLTVAPFSQNPLLSFSSRLENKGFNQLDDYMNEKVYPQLPELRRPETPEDMQSIGADDHQNDSIVFFDEAVNWFAYTWYLQKYVYYKLPVVSLDNYIRSLKPGTDPLSDLKQFNVKGVYYFLSVSDKVLDPVKRKNEDMMKLGPLFAKYLEANHYTGENIPDAQGNTAFRVYHIAF